MGTFHPWIPDAIDVLFVPVVAPARSAPVLPSHPQSALPAAHTTALEVPSVVVTIGDPRPDFVAHHAMLAESGGPALIFTATRLPVPPLGHVVPVPELRWNATYVPLLVV